MRRVVRIILPLHVLCIRLVIERLLRDLLIVFEIECSPAVNFFGVHPAELIIKLSKAGLYIWCLRILI